MIRIQNICNKDHHPSPDRRGYPTAGLEGWRAKGFGIGAYWKAKARGV